MYGGKYLQGVKLKKAPKEIRPWINLYSRTARANKINTNASMMLLNSGRSKDRSDYYRRYAAVQQNKQVKRKRKKPKPIYFTIDSE